MGEAGEPCADRNPGVDFAAIFRAIPTPYLVMSPDLVIVEANDAYLANVGRTREELLGRPVFEAFPPTPEALDPSGLSRIQVSFERARDTRRPDSMPLQKYDIPDGANGLIERFWSLISVPVLGPDGETAFVVQRAEDVTDFVRERERGEEVRERGEAFRRRVEEVETDLFARSQELAAAVRAQETASRRLASLAEVVVQLAGAESVEQLTDVVFSAGLPVLGAVGGSVAVRTPGSDQLEVTITPVLGDEVVGTSTRMPVAGDLPTSQAARGRLVLVPDEATAPDFPGLPDVLRVSGTRAWAALPLEVGDRVLGALTVGWAEPQAFPAEEVELLRAFAAQCAQVLDRLQIRQAERQAAVEVQRIAESLQRSLLTEPPKDDRFDVAVRYQPASHIAHVGGDWYDAFRSPASAVALTVVIGDVAGHDRDAAAAMAQVRNILRGVAQVLPWSPSDVLDALDHALAGLALDVLATVLLARLLQRPDQRVRGEWTFQWCNAGHPPPLLMRVDGTVELLDRESDLLVGLQPDVARADHEVTLRPGEAVLLYTDGLVETRGGDIQADLARLRDDVQSRWVGDALCGVEGHGVAQVLVDRLAEARRDPADDVALLAVRVATVVAPAPAE